MTPRFKTDAAGEVVPDVRAAAAIVFNPENGQVLYQENAQDKRSIASITKVMTALVFIEDKPGPDARKSRSSAATSTPRRRPICERTSASRSTISCT